MTLAPALDRRFAALKLDGRAAFIAFVTAGDPDWRHRQSRSCSGLPAAGADVIELGMPFSDPMADGPAVQASSLRALQRRADHAEDPGLGARFRAHDNDTPIVLMGYYNPIYSLSARAFPR